MSVQRCDILHKDMWVIQNIAGDGESLLKTGDFLENYLEADKRPQFVCMKNEPWWLVI